MIENLRVEHLGKDEILTDVSFEVMPGEMLAVMGPSGSGKSTLLYNVSGMDKPTSGSVWFEGQDITKLSEDEKARLRLTQMGFVFQQMNMLSNLDIVDNILLPAVQANRGRGGISKDELMHRALGLMESLSISDLEKRRISEVSGGQLQRACICRSLMNKPEILFADEPTGALNESATMDVMAELEKLNRAGMTIFLVTHDSGVASRCRRVLFLANGRVSSELVLEEPKNDGKKQREELLTQWLLEQGW